MCFKKNSTTQTERILSGRMSLSDSVKHIYILMQSIANNFEKKKNKIFSSHDIRLSMRFHVNLTSRNSEFLSTVTTIFPNFVPLLCEVARNLFNLYFLKFCPNFQQNSINMENFFQFYTALKNTEYSKLKNQIIQY